MKLYSGPMSMFGKKAEIALIEKGVKADVEMVPFDLRTRYAPKHPEVLRVNPKAQVPVLIDGDVELFDSTQIFEYLETIKPNPAFWPADPKARARARLLEHKSDEVFFPNVVKLFPPQVEAEAEAGRAAITAYYKQADADLGGKDFLAGEISYADIAFYMASLFATVLAMPITPDLKNLHGWKMRVGQREGFAKVTRATQDYLGSQGLKVDLAA